jgi:hypothetical protein
LGQESLIRTSFSWLVVFHRIAIVVPLFIEPRQVLVLI